MIHPSGEAHLQGGCGEQRDRSLKLPGEQTLIIGFDEPMRTVEITIDPASPLPITAEAFWRSNEGNVLVDRRRRVKRWAAISCCACTRTPSTS
ncbi:MAG: hypothetical protein U0521_03670 [Anaerolineae bacterium]